MNYENDQDIVKQLIYSPMQNPKTSSSSSSRAEIDQTLDTHWNQTLIISLEVVTCVVFLMIALYDDKCEVLQRAVVVLVAITLILTALKFCFLPQTIYYRFLQTIVLITFTSFNLIFTYLVRDVVCYTLQYVVYVYIVLGYLVFNAMILKLYWQTQAIQ